MAGDRRQHLIQEIDVTIHFIQTEFRKKKKLRKTIRKREVKTRHLETTTLTKRSSIDSVWALYSSTHRNLGGAVSIVALGLTREKLRLKFSMKLKNGLSGMLMPGIADVNIGLQNLILCTARIQCPHRTRDS